MNTMPASRLIPLLSMLCMLCCPLKESSGQDFAITELLALNDTGVVDAFGDHSDWIEIQNTGAEDADLEGWYLTDNPENLTKWRFPSVTLGPNEYALVFASERNRAVAGFELHANFKLSSDGEYLALVMPDGLTVHHAFAPRYPPQRVDVSYGLAEQTTSVLVQQGAAGRFVIPDNGSLGGDWTLAGFNDTAWAEGATGIGFNVQAPPPPPEEHVNLAPDGTATQSSDWGNGLFPAERGNDGDLSNFTATDANDAEGTWTVDLGGEFHISAITLHNRDSCCESRLRDITVVIESGEGIVRWESALLNPENILGGGTLDGPEALDIDLLAGLGHAVAGRRVHVMRTGDPDLSGTGGQGNNDERNTLSLGEVEVFGYDGGGNPSVATDVEEAMSGINSTLYLRLPFEVSDPDAIDALVLDMTYDDGFVAYINGVEVVRRNAPGVEGELLAWNAAADDATDDPAIETIEFTAPAGLLHPGTNVLAVQGLNRSPGDDDFLLLPGLRAISTSSAAARYFTNPTPADHNDATGISAFVADTRFSVDRGVFSDPFDVAITTETAGAEIRFTLDGSEPGPGTGTVYSGPIFIDGTTILRAAAFKPGLGPTNVDTQTYIFPDDVVDQSVMLADIARDPVLGHQVTDALGLIPSLSLVTTRTIGASVEVKTSVELIYPDSRPGFQIDAGILKVGGHSLGAYPKNMMRLYFRKQYGRARLDFPLFANRPYADTETAKSFDRLQLRSGAHDTIFYLGTGAQSPADAQYLRNRWISDMQFEMGHLSLQGFFIHLYINGTYWGHYHILERPNRAHMAEYMGGFKEDYEAVNGGSAVGDNPVPTWNHIKTLGSNYGAFQRYVDTVNYADYMVLNFYAGNDWDWRPNQNWMAGGPAAPDQGGFKFFAWDADIIFRRINDNNLARGGPENLFPQLMGDEEFSILFADRVHKHCFNDGCLTPAPAEAVYHKRAEEIFPTIIAETARWRWQGRVWTRENQWQQERDRLQDQFFPQRTEIVLDQLRSRGWYPAVAAPMFNQHGGAIDPGFMLLMDAPGGRIFYTLDGSDPRLPGGDIAPAAMELLPADTITLLDEEAEGRVLVPTDGTLGLDWIEAAFDDATWDPAPLGIGFDTGSTYDDLIGTNLQAAMYQEQGSVYLRLPFTVDDPDALVSVSLRMKYDDGFVAYVNGEFAASRNAPASPQWDATATASHADNQAIVFEDIPLSLETINLRPGGNVLAIHGLNLSAGSSDMLIVPRLVATTTAAANGIVLAETTHVNARAWLDGEWSALTEASFRVPKPIDDLCITEIMYHPPDEGEVAGDAYEFLELKNTGESIIDLSGVTFSGAVTFSCPQGTSLKPREVIVMVANMVAFREKYPAGDIVVLGAYHGNLSNEGEEAIVVRDTDGEEIISILYDDIPPWPEEADGTDYSLVFKDPAGGDDPNAPENWRASLFPGGTPGVDETEDPLAGGWQRPGDLNQDGALDLSDSVALLLYLFSDEGYALPCEGQTAEQGSNLVLLDNNGDGQTNLADAVNLLTYLFQRGSPHVLGERCVRMEGCPDACGL